ncbi:hypothetical protein KSP35_00725 [Aquihabitans sp. G128]|uniref:hypothetical protein n=1 Tax=Aquihabitans sp. G128 TaxID=2849779 RepID=UPI001C22A752|nr:hypothetical protein [Aquihabitans sp. G128]QXC61411.1 hypothetical protein KSP35_00725 [Aquihabitans sp. G128]
MMGSPVADPPPEVMDPHLLTVDFLDDVRELTPGQDLTFGRAADLVVDEGNRYLHRILGRLVFHDGLWWVENLGAQIELSLLGADGTSVTLPARAEGAPPSVAPLSVEVMTLGFGVAGARYEVELRVSVAAPPEAAAAAEEGAATLGYGRIVLTDEERQLLVALAEPVLRDVSARAESLPTNREAARSLGWTQPKFNRKLDYLCIRLTKAGVRGLQGGRGDEALNRRWRLVEHAVGTRLVTASDLPS